MARSVKVQRLSDFAARQPPVPAAKFGRRASGRHLGIIIQDFAIALAADGYAGNGVRRRVSVVEHFGRWLEQSGIALRRLSAEHADRFLRYHLAHCHCPEPAPKDRAHCRSAIARFVRYLEAQQLVRSIFPAPPPRSPVDRLLTAYDRHMKDVRGLSPGTRQNRHRDGRRFLQWCFGDRPLRLRRLQPKEVSGYVLARARHLRATALHPLCVNLRSFLRFLEFSGRLRRGLVGRVPQLPQRAVPALPKLLQPSERRAFLNSFARSTPRGRRDYAIALCLSDLALRGQEVASLPRAIRIGPP